MKTCVKCLRDLDDGEFVWAEDHARPRRRSNCRDCRRAASRAQSKAYYKVHGTTQRAKNKTRNFMTKYGFPPSHVPVLIEKQGGGCAICGTRTWTKHGPSVDHDHRTGAVRGILCNRCNAGIGFFSDDPNVLRAAASYLECAL